MIRGRHRLAAAGLAGAVLALAYVALVPAVYRSTAEIRIDPRPLQLPRRDARLRPVLENRTAIAYLESQVRLLGSTSVLAAAVDDLGLARDRAFGLAEASLAERAWDALADGLEAAVGAGPRRFPAPCPAGTVDRADACSDPVRAMALARLRRAVTVRRAPGSYVIAVQAESEEPDKAARIADGIVTAYLREARRGDAERQQTAGREVEAGLPALEATVAADGDRLDQARRRVGAVAGSGGPVEEQQLAELTRRLAEARAQARVLLVRSESLARLARSGPGLDAEAFADFPALQALRLQEAALAAQDGGQATRLGPRHPDAVRLSEQRDRVRALLRQELARTAQTLRNDHARARAAADLLAARAADLEARSLAAGANRVELRRLARVEAADGAALLAARRRAAELDQGSAVRVENVRVLGPAEPPRNPVLSRIVLVALSALSGVTVAAAWIAVRSRPDGTPPEGSADQATRRGTG